MSRLMLIVFMITAAALWYIKSTEFRTHYQLKKEWGFSVKLFLQSALFKVFFSFFLMFFDVVAPEHSLSSGHH